MLGDAWMGGRRRKRGIGHWEDFFVIPTANLVVSQENLSENGRLGCHAIACATVALSLSLFRLAQILSLF